MKSPPAFLSLLLGVIWSFSFEARAFQEPAHVRPPDFDVRKHPLQPTAPPDELRSGVDRLKGRVPKIKVRFDDLLQTPRFIMAEDGFLSGPQGEGRGIAAVAARALPANDPHRAIKAFLNDHSALFGHGAEALDSARKSRDYVAAHNGQRTVVWEQQFEGIPVFEAVLMGHISKNGELITLSSLFVPNLLNAAEAGTPNRVAVLQAPPISSSRALLNALKSLSNDSRDEPVTILEPPAGSEQRQKLKSPSLRKPAEARLVWLPMNRAALRLCWEVLLSAPAHGETFRVLVHAQSGEILLRRCLTVYVSDPSYRVYTGDSPTPFSPGHLTVLTNQPPQVQRVLVVTNAANTNASPNGWIDDGVNETRGNNVDAHLDRNDDDQPDLPRPQGSPTRVFDFPVDLAQDPATYGDAAVVQLFYWCNWMHDKLWELGFTEAAGNYQNDNFGRGGLGNDAIQADAQDGSGFNNANFSYAPDGSPPRVQMYIFNGPSPHRDGDFDGEVVLHELTHGLSGRLVGGGIGISLLQPSGMGEGWSDWYALALLSEPADDLGGNYPMGAYVTYRLSGLMQNYYSGIRRYPYTTNLARNPLTFKDIDPAQAAGHPGIPISPVFASTAADEVHAQGEVWCVTLWEMRAMLINKHGFTTGNHLSLQLVTDGMKLAPANPTFLEARDAIIEADQVLTGGANRTELWAAFAKRGMGFSASSPDSSTTAGVIESFDLPDDLRIMPGGKFQAAGLLGGQFTPNFIKYTLTNFGSTTVVWSVRSGTLVTLSTSGGSLAPGGPSSDLIVSLSPAARNLPAGVYRDMVTFSNQLSGVVQTRPVTLKLGQPDYFTEFFDRGNNDLDFQTLVFTPDGSKNFSSACRTTATNFPTNPVGTDLSLTDDGFAPIALVDGATVRLYGQAYTSMYVSANGYITFGDSDQSYAESTSTHFSLPRISGLFRDLNPSVAGKISWKQFSDRVAVTWQDVPEYGTANSNSFQIEMFFDGTIRLTYLAIATSYGLAGLSRGGGEPAGYTASDLSAYEPCVSTLALTFPKSLSESAGVIPNQGVVSIPQPAGSNVIVSLESSDPAQLALAPTATILAGQTNAFFSLTAFDNAWLDGSRIVRLTATAPGYRHASDTLTINDNEADGGRRVTLNVSLPANATEGDGFLAGAGKITLSSAPDRSIVVYLFSSDTNQLTTPPAVIIPAGQLTAFFDLMIGDDAILNGAHPVSVTAHVENWTDATASMNLLDNELPPPPLAISRAGTSFVLSWPTGYSNFALESTTNLRPNSVWTPVFSPVQTTNGQMRTIITPATRQQFFRLSNP